MHLANDLNKLMDNNNNDKDKDKNYNGKDKDKDEDKDNDTTSYLQIRSSPDLILGKQKDGTFLLVVRVGVRVGVRVRKEI